MIGIYKITNIITGHFYIGSSLDCRMRRNTHFSKLKSNSHDNSRLQQAYNQHGKNPFKFEIIAVLHKDISIKQIEYIEAKFIEILNPYYNFFRSTTRKKEIIENINKPKKIHKNSEPAGICQSREFKEKMSKITSEHYKKLTDEEKSKRNKHKYGRKISEETRKKLSDKRKIYHQNRRSN